MTQEEMRRFIDALSRPVAEPRPSQMYAQPVFQSQGFEPGVCHLSRDDEYMAERSWIKKMFEDAILASPQESDRHPRHTHYMGHWVEPRDECSRAARRRTYGARSSVANEPAELTAGDTSQLDDFLGGFVKREV